MEMAADESELAEKRLVSRSRPATCNLSNKVKSLISGLLHLCRMHRQAVKSILDLQNSVNSRELPESELSGDDKG